MGLDSKSDLKQKKTFSHPSKTNEDKPVRQGTAGHNEIRIDQA